MLLSGARFEARSDSKRCVDGDVPADGVQPGRPEVRTVKIMFEGILEQVDVLQLQSHVGGGRQFACIFLKILQETSPQDPIGPWGEVSCRILIKSP